MHGSVVEALGQLGMEEGEGNFGPEQGPGCAQGCCPARLDNNGAAVGLRLEDA